MSNPPTDSPASLAEISNLFSKHLPEMGEAVRGQVGPFAQTNLDAARQVSPGYAELLNDLYAQYAPGLAKTGTQVEDISRRGQAATDLGLLQDYAPSLMDAHRKANPEQFAVQSDAAKKLGELLNSINLNDASPEAERLIGREAARSGNLATPSATSTTSNALSFGREMDNRRNQLGQAISLATQFIPASQGGFNPVTNLMARGATGTGSNQFAGVAPLGGDAQALGSQLLGHTTDTKQQQNQLKYTAQETAQGWIPNISV